MEYGSTVTHVARATDGPRHELAPGYSRATLLEKRPEAAVTLGSRSSFRPGQALEPGHDRTDLVHALFGAVDDHPQAPVGDWA